MFGKFNNKYWFDINVEWTPQLVVFTNYEGPHSSFVNTCILITKQYIYAQKCQKQTLNFMQITSKIHMMYIDEKFIATKNKKIHKNNKKWLIYQKCL